MGLPVPPAPLFGEACPPHASPDTLALLSQRRSSSAQLLGDPAPGEAELADLLRLAARVPDHGKMQPWRCIVLRGDDKATFVERLRTLAALQPNPEKAQGALFKIATPPLCVAVVSSTREGGKPVWEQQLSAGAVCMTLLIAAQAMGYGANWITDWYGYDRAALTTLGLREGETLAGWIMLGTPSEPPLERVRPDMASIVSVWTG
ncbi:nitroreductase [soil metagenome]